MSHDDIDRELQQLYRSHARKVDSQEFAEALGKRLTKASRPAIIGPTPRRVGLVMLGLAVAAGLVIGGLQVIQHLSRPSAVLVLEESTESAADDEWVTGDKAELLAEVRHIRQGLETGTLAFDWSYPPGVTAEGALPSDPMKLLDYLEESSLACDVTLYLKDNAGEAAPLVAELRDMSEVLQVVYAGKEAALERLKKNFKVKPEALENLQGNPFPASLQIWLADYQQAKAFADTLRARPEVEEAQAPPMDYAGWTARLRSLTRSPGSGETVTTWVHASTTIPGAAPQTTTTMVASAETALAWGGTATVSDVDITAMLPKEDPDAVGLRPDSKVVYSLVTITNTGSNPISYGHYDFLIEGGHSGGTGYINSGTTVGGYPAMNRGTLAAGETVTAAVRFDLSANDRPVRVCFTPSWAKDVSVSWK
ncbi:MAG: permease-like cell division protein FtsX [Thermoleophilia bacterium]|jgi:hypothetical protein